MGQSQLGIAAVLILVIASSDLSLGHGRMLEPPNRSSLWRLPEFENVDPPVEFNYDDDQLYCGSLGNMVNNGGRCGVCGDPYELQRPRENENGGLYGQGLVVRNYEVGQVIDIAIELTTNHWGYFVWNLCNLENPNEAEPEDCFEKYPLQLGDASGLQYNLTNNNRGWFNTTIKLPEGLRCDRCVLRWHYRAGNNWEFCSEDKENANGSTGCGYQEVFRSCADIAIGSSVPVTPRPKLTSTTEDWEASDEGQVQPTAPTMRPPKASRVNTMFQL